MNLQISNQFVLHPQVDYADNNNGIFTAPYSGSDVPLMIGAQGSVGSGIFAQTYGSQKDVRLYSRPLSASEIGTLYANGTSGASASTTTVSSSGNPARAGSMVTWTATVSASGGTPTGTVAFLDGSSSLGTGTLNRSGLTTLSTAALPVGSNGITAIYSGDSIFSGSTSSVLSEIITNVGASGANITNGLVAEYPLSANGNDIWAGNNLALGGRPAFSNGAINWNGDMRTYGYSSPRQWPQNGLTVSAWINMAVPSADYNVVCCYGNLTSTVNRSFLQFYTYNGMLGARVIQSTDAIYIGRYTPAALTAGWHLVAFTWSGGASSSAIKIYLDGAQADNANNNAGTFTAPYAGSDVPLMVGMQGSVGSGSFAQFYGSQKDVRLYNRALSASEIGTLYASGTAGGSASTTTVSSSENPAGVLSMVTLTATVSGSGATPTGTVAFLDGGASLGTGSLNKAGVASLSTAGLPVGSNGITAVYSGDSIFAGSTSSVLSEIITNFATTNITNGLVAEYPLSANGNDTWAGNNLSLVGGPTFSGGAINWIGAVPAYGCSSPRQWPQSGLTVSAWMNMGDWPWGGWDVVSCYGNPTGSINSSYLQFYAYNGMLGARIIQSTDASYIGRYTPVVLPGGGWHLLAFTWSGGTSSSAIKIYRDGVQVDSTDNSGGVFTAPYAGSDVPLMIGAQGSVGSGIYAPNWGSQQDVRIYNRALSASEIATLYVNGTAPLIVAPGAHSIVVENTFVRLLPNENVQMTFTGSPGQVFRILASANLLSWQTIATLTNLTGTLEFTDSASTNFKCRFYQIVTP